MLLTTVADPVPPSSSPAQGRGHQQQLLQQLQFSLQDPFNPDPC